MPQDTPELIQPIRHSLCESGALRLTVRGDPVHVHACTCTRRQRASGSAMTTSAWLPETAVTIEGDYITWHCTETADPALMAGFCRTCGTGRFFRTGAYLPGTIGIATGNFADPAFPDPAFPAPDHIHWWPDRPHWLGPPNGPPPYPETDP